MKTIKCILHLRSKCTMMKLIMLLKKFSLKVVFLKCIHLRSAEKIRPPELVLLHKLNKCLILGH